MGGDITLIASTLGGAAFRVVLPQTVGDQPSAISQTRADVSRSPQKLVLPHEHNLIADR